jgi:hypothetical protein
MRDLDYDVNEYIYSCTYAVCFRSSGCSLRMVCGKPKHVGACIVLI